MRVDALGISIKRTDNIPHHHNTATVPVLRAPPEALHFLSSMWMTYATPDEEVDFAIRRGRP